MVREGGGGGVVSGGHGEVNLMRREVKRNKKQ